MHALPNAHNILNLLLLLFIGFSKRENKQSCAKVSCCCRMSVINGVERSQRECGTPASASP